MRLDQIRKPSEYVNIHRCPKLGNFINEKLSTFPFENFNNMPQLYMTSNVLTERNTQPTNQQYSSNERNTTRDRYTAWHGHRKVILSQPVPMIKPLN